jgi:chemotaxis response regulator CheB
MSPEQSANGGSRYPVVCIGMSAGGIEPLRDLFQSLNPATGMAFVIVHHLRDHPPDDLAWLLARWTSMPVHVVEEGAKIRPNEVYVIPSGKEISLTDATLVVKPRSKTHGWTNVVTLFINSLRHSQHCGIAVILSGLDENGSAALKAFKQHGGITIAQEPDTASYPDMPQAAIETGAVDYVLPPKEIAAELEKIAAELAGEKGVTAP